MQAYEASLRSNDTRLVIKPDSDFFRYFGDPSGRPRDSGDSNKTGDTNKN
jgi:membrane protease subunit HflC